MRIESLYSHLSDHLFINFLNTIRHEYDQTTDILEKKDVDEWFSLMKDEQLLTDRQIEKLKEAPVSIHELQSFRDRWRTYLQHSSNELPIDELERSTKETPLSFELSSGSLVPVPHRGGTDGFLSLLSFLMLQAYENSTFSKVKNCDNPTCLALFVDKKGKRKWCSMKVCGNRVKAQKHYDKKKAES
ncbi:CGNR zinc finger domain-containing protein [Salimicrobium flavidum]|uniref:CGNR zinc finger domain-containing protein n=1 Tax=Salimicrobium flavidum TaxID=570947 RepID=A0A1N7KUN1_9BACI|nr:CGNR zinc finger domain-containing protein [Salimicrobium flavidum]SIS65120.1 CGNR zinc finger domain-containing protein [Salimicrobium flavidum]